MMIPRRDVTSFGSVLASLPGWPVSTGGAAELERGFERRFGYLRSVTVSSGREGLRLILKALKGRVPELAWVPAWTIPAVPEIFAEEGFEVRFVDVDPGSLCLTPAIVDRTCDRPGILLVTHYFGLPADMTGIMKTAVRRGLKVIEDCAHAPGAMCSGRPVASFGLGGFFSFETRKPLNGLGGGLVCTNSCEMAAAIEDVHVSRDQEFLHDAMKLAMTSAEWLMLRRPVFAAVSKALYSETLSNVVVSAYRSLHGRSRKTERAFSDRQAAAVLGQIDGLAASISKKRATAAIYDAGLPPAFTRPMNPEDRPHGYYMYVTTHPDAHRVGTRLRESGIDCGIGAEVLSCCDTGGRCPGASRLVETAIELPMYTALSPVDAERVCRVAGSVCGR